MHSSVAPMDEAKTLLSIKPFHRAGWHLTSPSFAARYIFRQPIRAIKCRWRFGLKEPQAKRHGPHGSVHWHHFPDFLIVRRPLADHPWTEPAGDQLDRMPPGHPRPQMSRDTKQIRAELAKRCSLSAQAVNLRPYRRCQGRIRCVPAKFAELMLEVLLGLQRDIPPSPCPLEFGDELSSYTHLPMIGEFAASNRPNLDSFLQFLGNPEGDLLARLDLDGLARRWIASHPGGTFSHLEDAETVQADF